MPYKILLTPLHPDGYPKVGRSYRDKDPHAAFLMRHLSGGPVVTCATRDEAEGYADRYKALRDERPRQGNQPSRYDLEPTVVGA
jgi:hypothetical protein